MVPLLANGDRLTGNEILVSPVVIMMRGTVFLSLASYFMMHIPVICVLK